MRIAFITPNLSTGGMPEYVRRSIELLDREANEILLIEMRTEKVLDAIRKRVLDLDGIELFSAERSPIRAVEKIRDFSPDVIHFTEPSEQVINPKFLDQIYDENRKWKIFETCHDSSYPLKSKKFLPDKFLLVSPFQVEMMQDLGVPSELVQYDVPELTIETGRETNIRKLGLDPEKKHIFQFGIFSPRKNQSETIDIAKMMLDEPVQFHFVGNTADSYSYYWKPLLENLPKNCKFWGEHKNVQQFYAAADLVVFPSIELLDDKETNPLVIKETIKYGIPLLLKDTPVYLGMFPEREGVIHMKSTPMKNANAISQILGLKEKTNMIKITFHKEDNKLEVYSEDAIGNVVISVKDIDSEAAIYSFNANYESPKSTWWCKPVPIEYFDFHNNPDFSGFLVEIYSEDRLQLLESATLYLKNSQLKRKIPKLHNFEPLFINYDQFFVKRIYDNLFAGERMDNIIDVGASVGLFTQWALDRFGRGTNILAFEPNPVAIQGFKNVHGEKIKVKLHEAAVASFEGEIELGINPENSIVSSVNMNTENKIKVKTITLKSAMEELGWAEADLLKVDIEGGEYDLIANTEDFPFRFILLEFHDNEGQLEDLISKLETKGYEIDIRQEDARYQASSKERNGVILAKKKFTNE
jgi:FkbM family methyltransferase